MYKTTIFVSAAVLASTAYAGSPGSAVVINGCNYPVYLSSVPAEFGGQQTTNQVLEPKESYSQQWTQLTNGAGWSIKLAKEQGASSIMQYEYTYQNDGTIWYDLSCVDGNPWDKNWEVTAANDKSCSPRQAAYRYATDDAYGMQSCAAEASLTVTLCSGESQNDGGVSSIAAVHSTTSVQPQSPSTTSTKAPAPTTTSTSTKAPTTTSTSTPAPVPTSTSITAPAPAATTSSHAGNGYPINFHNNVAAESTTLSTAVTTPRTHAVGKPIDAADNVVYVYETVVETATAYETYVPGKRHVHHPEHPHFR